MINLRLEPFSKSKEGHVVTIGELDVYFSYKTPIAFNHPETGTVGRVNEWGTTTGKHMSAVPGNDKDKRINGAEFEALLENTLKLAYKEEGA